MNINIYQFLKQGTSLNRNSLNDNKSLEKQIIYTKPLPNYNFDKVGRFNQSDSQEQQLPKTNKKQLLEKYHQRQSGKNAELLKKNHIKVQGLDCPKALSNFTKIIKNFKIKEPLIKGLQNLGYTKPTSVQKQVIPCLIQKRNLIVTAPTGTGKTLSYLLPLLQNLNKSDHLTAIILTPIQQLSNQLIAQLNSLIDNDSTKKNDLPTYQCISKLSQNQQNLIKTKGKLQGVNILISTPMSFLNLFNQQKSRKALNKIEYIILDECDKYFQQSFLDQIKQFLELFQSLNPIYALFSATIQHPVQQLLKSQILHDCLRIQVGGKNKVLDKISQSIQYCTNQYGKLVYLKNLIIEGGFIPPCIIFVQQKQRAKQLYYELRSILKSTIGGKQKIQILSGDKSKQQRQQIIQKFDSSQYWAIITTDLISRGIDFKNVCMVINYDFPNSMLTYIHRVGRTGRAERDGKAITLFTDEDKPAVRSLANLLKVSGCQVPEWICTLKKANKSTLKKLQKHPARRLPVGHSTGKDKSWTQQLQRLQSKWQKLKKRQTAKQQRKDNQGWIQVQKDQD